MKKVSLALTVWLFFKKYQKRGRKKKRVVIFDHIYGTLKMVRNFPRSSKPSTFAATLSSNTLVFPSISWGCSLKLLGIKSVTFVVFFADIIFLKAPCFFFVCVCSNKISSLISVSINNLIAESHFLTQKKSLTSKRMKKKSRRK